MPVKLGKCGKQKTRKNAAKRFKKTNGGKGKTYGEGAGSNHLLMQKSADGKKERKNFKVQVTGKHKKMIARAMPNS